MFELKLIYQAGGSKVLAPSFPIIHIIGNKTSLIMMMEETKKLWLMLHAKKDLSTNMCQ